MTNIVKTNVEQKNGHEKEINTMCGCMVESHESTRQRAESLQSKAHEDRIDGKGFTSMTQYNLALKVTKLFAQVSHQVDVHDERIGNV